MKKAIFKTKPAFTMLELVFVIVVVGILAAVILPRMQQSRLQEAADQIASHIRYTQHLAMQDDKYDTDNADWHKERWQIFFEKSTKSNEKWSYSIYSDNSPYNGDPDLSEIATNPQDPSTLLTGGSSLIDYTLSNVTKALRVGDEYGIINITFGEGCGTADHRGRIIFDYMGRPMVGKSSEYSSVYPDKKLFRNDCVITLTNDASETIDITIRPETGYVSIG